VTTAAPRLTWHPGSLRPYASLWHTLQRAAALNRLRIGELPDFRGCQSGDTDHTVSPVNVLLNERSEAGQIRVALSTDVLAKWLGEPASLFAWSHLGALPHWARQLVFPGFRLCRQCLTAGYHSALTSISLLQACPIHGTELVDQCTCGRPFLSRLSGASLLHAGHCACGKLALFTRDTCRQPSLSANETRAFEPLVTWLEALTRISRPHFRNKVDEQADWNTWLSTLVQWGTELGIDRPACVVAPHEQHRRYPVHHACGPLKGNGPSKEKQASNQERLVFEFWPDEPEAWVYRAMQRHLRRHVVRDSDHWIQKFMALSDPIGIANLMRENRAALLAFAEMQWARTLEPEASNRRWPYRIDYSSWGIRVPAALALRGIRTETRNLHLSKDQQEWLDYQASGAVVTAVWRHAVAYALQTAKSGVADWAVDEHPNPLPENWSVRQGSDGLHFLNLLQDHHPDWLLPRADKGKRQAREKTRASQAHQLVMETCSGSCLSWNQHDGWHVTDAWVPVDGVFHRHRMLGFAEGRPLFWLFEANDGFVARLQDMKLQSWADTPKQAIDTLRQCLRRHRATYGYTPTCTKVKPMRTPANSQPSGSPSEVYYQILVLTARKKALFWGNNRELTAAAHRMLYEKGFVAEQLHTVSG